MSKRNYIPIAVGDLIIDSANEVFYVLKIKKENPDNQLWIYLKNGQHDYKFLMYEIRNSIREKYWKLQKYDEH